ncbi:MAG: DNA-methyltransferase [Candidatus Thorarchaeota archaeon]
MIKLYNGDCLEIMDQLIKENVKFDAIITDPPYGTTACKWDSIIPFDEMWNRLKLLRKEKTPIVLFGSEPFSSALRTSNIKEYKYDWIWIKNKTIGFLNAKKQPLRSNETISIFYKKQCLYNPQKMQGLKPVNKYTKNTSDGETVGKTKTGITGGGNTDRYPINTIYFKVVNQDGTNDGGNFHPTQKPVKLMEYLIKTYTKENDLVLDFTMGSGTTGVACKNLNCNFIGIEKEEKYFKIAEKRVNKIL